MVGEDEERSARQSGSLSRHCERGEAIQGSGTIQGAAHPWVASLRSQ